MATINGRPTQQQLAITVQPVLGTAVAPVILVPFIPGTLNATVTVERVRDDGRRGKTSAVYGIVAGGTELVNISFEAYVYKGADNNSDTDELSHIGYFLANIMECDETDLNNVATNINEHRLIVGTKKNYLTVEIDYGLAAAKGRRYINCRVTDLEVTWSAAEGALKYSVTMMGVIDAAATELVTVVALTDKTAGRLFPSSIGVSTVNGNGTSTGAHQPSNSTAAEKFEPTDSFGRLLSGNWSLSRQNPQPWYSLDNTVSPVDIYFGELQVTTEMKLVYNDDADLAAWRAESQGICAVSFFSTEDEDTFGIGGAKVDLGDSAPISEDGGMSVLTITGESIHTTDVGPFTSKVGAEAATAQNGPVQVQIIQTGTDAHSTGRPSYTGA